MAKLEKKEIIEKVIDKVEDTDSKMELLEDIADSFKESEKEVVDKSEYDALMKENQKLKTDYDDLKNKYISRFSSVSSQEKNEVSKPEELKESKIIDVRSIF